jgi:hypothetical protein
MEHANEAERRFFNPKAKSEIEAEMKERGFHFAGYEGLTTFKFSKGALFEVEPVKTKEDVLLEYQKRLGDQFEIELVEEEGLGQNQQAVLVFARNKVESGS